MWSWGRVLIHNPAQAVRSQTTESAAVLNVLMRCSSAFRRFNYERIKQARVPISAIIPATMFPALQLSIWKPFIAALLR